MALQASYSPASSGTSKQYKIHNICIEESAKCKALSILVSQDQLGSKLRLLRVYMHPANQGWQVLRGILGKLNPPASKHVAAADLLAKQLMQAGGISITETSSKQNGKSVFTLTAASLYDVDTDPIAWEASPTPLGKIYKSYLGAITTTPAKAQETPQEPELEMPMDEPSEEDKQQRAVILQVLTHLDSTCTYSGSNTIQEIIEAVKAGRGIDYTQIMDLNDANITKRFTNPPNMGRRLKGSLELYMKSVCC